MASTPNMPDHNPIANRLAVVTADIHAAAAEVGRPAPLPRIVAVSKGHPPEALRAAQEAGLSLFGESRVQEARAKISLLPTRFRWHFIGHLQRNKIRQALPCFELFHGIDSVALAEEMDRMAAEACLHPSILLEVNIAGESSKFGLPPEALEPALDQILRLPRLQVCGLMGMAPLVEKPDLARPYFARLRECRDRAETRLGIGLPELSMGMSGDYVAAVQEGATLLRIGTALFGERAGWRPGDATH